VRRSLLALALVHGAPALAAQEARPAAGAPLAPVVSATAVEARLAAIADTAVRTSIGALIAEASRRGLPAEPLVTKALEGVEKNAPPARIEAAVRATASRLATARTALAPVLTVTDLKAGADALGAGVPADVLSRVREAAGGRPVAVPVGVVAQLTARGVSSELAGSAVVVLLRRGAGHAHLLALQEKVQEDLAVGVSPSTSLDIRTRNLTTVLPPPVQQASAAEADAPTLQSGPRNVGPGAPNRPTGPRKKP
jgi:hypothetical protein